MEKNIRIGEEIEDGYRVNLELFNFAVAGITNKQAEHLMEIIVQFVEGCGGYVGGGWSFGEDEDGEEAD